MRLSSRRTTGARVVANYDLPHHHPVRCRPMRQFNVFADANFALMTLFETSNGPTRHPCNIKDIFAHIANHSYNATVRQLDDKTFESF